MLNVQIKRKGFKMIELRTYTIQELSEILGSRGKQGIDNKNPVSKTRRLNERTQEKGLMCRR